jgi:cytochrome P450
VSQELPQRFPEAAEFRHPFDPRVWPDPSGAYQWLREHEPLFEDPASGMTLVSRHADCSALLRDRDASAANSQRLRARGEPLPRSMLNTDPPEHDALRAPAMVLLGPQAAASLEPALALRISEILSRRSLGQYLVDGLAAIAIPFATAVLASLLDLPESRWPEFTRLLRRASVNLDPTAGPAQTARGAAPTQELIALLRTHALQLTKQDDDSLLRSFWTATELDDQERMAAIMLVVIGGFEPLINLAATGLYELARRPQLVKVIADGDGAEALAFVDEVLRLQSPIPLVGRHTTGDIHLPSGEMFLGTSTLALLCAANRDPAVVDAPDELRLDRAATAHLAFGAGPHFCPGAPLVRLAGRLLFTALVERFPRLGLADPSVGPRWRRSIVPRGLAVVPVLLRPAAGT